MDVATFETAVKLKEAGFPQPEVKPGQFWWFVRFPDGSAKKEVLCVVTEVYSAGVKQPGFKFVPIEGGEFEGRLECYAPTATDILRELPGFDLGFYTAGPIFAGFGPSWCVEDIDGYMNEKYYSTSPTETCAAVWLEEKEQAQ